MDCLGSAGCSIEDAIIAFERLIRFVENPRVHFSGYVCFIKH